MSGWNGTATPDFQARFFNSGTRGSVQSDEFVTDVDRRNITIKQNLQGLIDPKGIVHSHSHHVTENITNSYKHVGGTQLKL